MENADIARTLTEVADIMEITGGNAFRARAYRNAAQVIDTLSVPVSDLWRRGELDRLPGIGTGLAAHVEELITTGALAEHTRLRSLVPPGLLELLEVEGMGPKSVAAVWKTLGVTSLDQLEQCCRDERICEVPRMGPTRARGILKAIEQYRTRKGRTPLHRALPYAEAMVARLRQVPGVVRAEVAGSVRRRCETVGDIDVLVATRDPAPVMRAFVALPDVAQVLAEGPTKSSVKLRLGLQVDLRVLPPESMGAALHYFTGSKAHNIAVRTRAVRMGLKLNEYGVFDREGHRLGGEREEDVFRAVGLPRIPPELREDRGELEAAESGRLPRLVEERDLRGDLHVHSADSAEAKSGLDELVTEAHRLGWRYMAITDHSRSRPLGLDTAGLHAQAERIRQFGHEHRGFPRLLTGVEVDILADGSLDLPLEVLAELDCVVASVHSYFVMPRDQMTERLIRALRSGVVHVLGHPSGRELGVRDAYDFDLERVLAVAREMDVALEVNAMPSRLDLTDKACRVAKEAGVPVVISSDAHHTSHLANLRYGVWVARRGWLEAGDVLNTLPLDQLRRRLRRRHAPTEHVAPAL